MEAIVISVDGACSGRRCACPAIAMQNGRLVAEGSRNLPEAGGYGLGAKIAGVLAAQQVEPGGEVSIIVETDNPDVPRVIERGYRPRQAARLPASALAEAIAFAHRYSVAFKSLPPNSTPDSQRCVRDRADEAGWPVSRRGLTLAAIEKQSFRRPRWACQVRPKTAH